MSKSTVFTVAHALRPAGAKRGPKQGVKRLAGAYLAYAFAGLLPAQAANTIAENYTRISAGETVLAPFTALSTSTQTSFSGPVELLVTGTGYSLGSTINDAFYFDGGGSTTGFYMLNIGWNNAPLVGGSRARVATNVLTFIDNVGAVLPGSRPAYAADHSYRFVIDVPATAGPLRFGVSDGNFGDNGGAYTVTAWQLQVGAVPEPAAMSLTLAGLSLVAFAAARKRRELARVTSR